MVAHQVLGQILLTADKRLVLAIVGVNLRTVIRNKQKLLVETLMINTMQYNLQNKYQKKT